MVHFNYAYSLFLAGKYAEVAEQLRPVITADPKDGQAYFLFAKALEKTGKTEAATAADRDRGDQQHTAEDQPADRSAAKSRRDLEPGGAD